MKADLKKEFDWRPPRKPGQKQMPDFLSANSRERTVRPANFGTCETEQSEPAEQLPETEPDEDPDLLEAREDLTADVPESEPEPESVDPAPGNAQAVASLIDQIRRFAKELIVDLSVNISKRILRKNVEIDPDWVIQNAEACLERNVPNGGIKLRVHPRDRDQILSEDPLPGWLQSQGGAVDLVADPELAPGDCILESDRARIDGRIAVQVEHLRELLLELLTGALFEES